MLKRLLGILAIAVGFTASPYIGYAAKVVIDPGHGGSDPGAVGVNGLYEKTVNYDISLRLADLLAERGYDVVMTRADDSSLSLYERVERTKAAGADLFVSVHSNSHPSSSVAGSMVLYYDAAYPNPHYPASEEMKALTPESGRLARAVLNGILEQVPNINRGLVPSSAYVVRMGNIPSILVETAFLSNRSDADMLANPNVRALYAVGIANGIAQYVPPGTFRDIAGHWARESIVRLKDQGIANGNNGSFYPDQPLTRAELVAFADRAFGLQAKSKVRLAEAGAGAEAGTVTESVYGEEAALDPTEDPAEGPTEAPADPQTEGPPASGAPEAPAPRPAVRAIPDLPEAHWSYGVMNTAIERGIIRGYPDGTVRPDAPVTRSEVAAVMDRLLSLENANDNPVSYKDVVRSNWAYEAIMRLSASGIVRGIAERLYGPDRYVTRAEMATMVDRQLTKADTKRSLPF